MDVLAGAGDEEGDHAGAPATAAETADAWVKPASVAIPAAAPAVRIIAETCEPSEKPTERTSA